MYISLVSGISSSAILSQSSGSVSSSWQYTQALGAVASSDASAVVAAVAADAPLASLLDGGARRDVA